MSVSASGASSNGGNRWIHCISLIYREIGLKVCYRGYLPATIVVQPIYLSGLFISCYLWKLLIHEIFRVLPSILYLIDLTLTSVHTFKHFVKHHFWCLYSRSIQKQ